MSEEIKMKNFKNMKTQKKSKVRPINVRNERTPNNGVNIL